jgi:hypothetical protein
MALFLKLPLPLAQRDSCIQGNLEGGVGGLRCNGTGKWFRG